MRRFRIDGRRPTRGFSVSLGTLIDRRQRGGASPTLVSSVGRPRVREIVFEPNFKESLDGRERENTVGVTVGVEK